ncbi:MAG: hypothetical protein COB04_07125 [Gammaproteobacteria bacterium]|nr:MAG: hypothetical protein COB04_07125 [Gammaproteobacteria bacterium]
MIRLPIVLLAAFVVSGCAVSKVDPSQFSPVDIDSVENLPSKELLQGRKARAVVFRTDEKSSLSKTMSLGDATTGSIEAQLSATTEIIDRSLASKLKGEIQLGELSGATSNGPSLADFAVLSEISAAKWNKRYAVASSYTDDEGKVHRTPAKCHYDAEVQGNVKVYSLPSMSLINTISVGAKSRSSEDARHRHCNTSKAQQAGLLNAAATKAIKKQKHQLKNIFAPTGYILGRRVNEEGSIFRVSLGAKRGIQAGSTVSITRSVLSHSQLGGDLNEVLRLGTAKVVSPVEENYAWLYVKDEVLANKIKLGDTIKINYKKSLLSSLTENIPYADLVP